MSHKTIDNKQGHWILAKMGKKVLRPGGKELTLKMLENLHITSKDEVVEFAPGLGFTALMTLRNNPKSYTGVELNQEAASYLRKKVVKGHNQTIVVGNAAKSTLNDETATKVYGEAMLTMHPDQSKSAIIKEAHRILKKGGLYGIHELGLIPNDIADDIKKEIQKSLAHAIKVNARPLTLREWSELLEKEGFTIEKTATNPMHLLEPKRVIDDEGFFRTLKIIFNILTQPKARKRIMQMRKTFSKYEDNLNAITIVARKN